MSRRKSKVQCLHSTRPTPALGRDYVYLSSSQGHLLSVHQIRSCFPHLRPQIFEELKQKEH